MKAVVTVVDLFNEFMNLEGAVFVGQEVCDHRKQPCDCYNNYRQAEITYNGERITVLESRDGLHVAFGILEEYPPDACELYEFETLLRLIKESK